MLGSRAGFKSWVQELGSRADFTSWLQELGSIEAVAIGSGRRPALLAAIAILRISLRLEARIRTWRSGEKS
jgi:hypothetical protein